MFFYSLCTYKLSHFENVWNQSVRVLNKNELKLAISMKLSTADDFFCDPVYEYPEILDFFLTKQKN
jgi:hypothetical protein